MHTLHIGFFVTGVLPLSPIVCRVGERFFLFPFPILSPTGAAPTQLQDEKFVFFLPLLPPFTIFVEDRMRLGITKLRTGSHLSLHSTFTIFE